MDAELSERKLLQAVADLEAAGGVVESTAVTTHTGSDQASVHRELRRLLHAGLLDGVVEEGARSPMPPKITNLHLTPAGAERLGR